VFDPVTDNVIANSVVFDGDAVHASRDILDADVISFQKGHAIGAKIVGEAIGFASIVDTYPYPMETLGSQGHVVAVAILRENQREGVRLVQWRIEDIIYVDHAAIRLGTVHTRLRMGCITNDTCRK